jgi:hypothetical protein
VVVFSVVLSRPAAEEINLALDARPDSVGEQAIPVRPRPINRPRAVVCRLEAEIALRVHRRQRVPGRVAKRRLEVLLDGADYRRALLLDGNPIRQDTDMVIAPGDLRAGDGCS